MLVLLTLLRLAQTILAPDQISCGGTHTCISVDQAALSINGSQLPSNCVALAAVPAYTCTAGSKYDCGAVGDSSTTVAIVFCVDSTDQQSAPTANQLFHESPFGINAKSGTFSLSSLRVAGLPNTDPTFLLTYTPNAGSLEVSLNGKVLAEGVDYSLSGLTITFLGYVPQPSDALSTIYTHQ